MKYFEEANAIWRDFVPKSGQAETVQGELLRAVEKFRDEATRNGNGNWDEGFDILLAYLRYWLLDPSVYTAAVIEQTKATLNLIADYEQPMMDDDLYDELGDRVVEYFHHYGSQAHARNDALWR